MCCSTLAAANYVGGVASYVSAAATYLGAVPTYIRTEAHYAVKPILWVL